MYIGNFIDYFEKNLHEDDENPQLLAKLFLQFRENKKSYEYTKKAADLLYSVHRTEEALVLYEEIIEGLLEKAGDSFEIAILIDSVISYVPIAIYIKPPDGLLHIINETIPLADKMENKRARVMLELCLGSLLQKQGKYLEASPYYDRGWNLARKIEDENLVKSAAKLYALSLLARPNQGGHPDI